MICNKKGKMSIKMDVHKFGFIRISSKNQKKGKVFAANLFFSFCSFFVGMMLSLDVLDLLLIPEKHNTNQAGNPDF